MDRCPYELWQNIFQLACTDGGLAGCSLALVSHRFRQAVLPLQLHSVALCGLDKMQAFVRLMNQRELEPAHRRVRHLFLSLSNKAPDRGLLTEDERVQNIRRARDDKLIMDGVLRQLFAAVAPELLTLASTVPPYCMTEFEIRLCSLPCLTELAWDGWCLWPVAPSLRYLHILSSGCFTLLRYAGQTPALTHLRLSGVDMLRHEWRRDFEVTMRQTLSGDTKAGGFPPLPSTLERIIIQTYPLFTFTPDMRTPMIWYDLLEESLHLDEQLGALKLLDKDGKLEIIREPEEKVQEVFNHSIRNDWEARITGGAGCWGNL